MYPIIDYGHTDFPLCDSMFWNPDYLDPLNPNNEVGNYTQFEENTNYYGLITANNLKPAIRLQRLLKIIAAKAGYSITSTFLGLTGDVQDKTTFFGRQFMTLAPQYERTRVEVMEGFSASTTTVVTDTMGNESSGNTFTLEGIQFETINYNTNNYFSNTNADGDTAPSVSVSYDPESGEAIPFGELTIQVDMALTLPLTTVGGATIQSFTITHFMGIF